MGIPEIERKIGINVYVTKTAGIGGVIRRKPEDFVVEEILIDGKKASVEFRKPPPRLGRFLVCVLVKRDWDMLLAIDAIARQLKISPDRIGFAGIKDANAVTAQHISVYGVRPEEIERVRIKGIDIYPAYYAEEEISTRLLFGNQFTVRVRSVLLEKSEVLRRVDATVDEFLALGGVPNFFGHQRFGTVRPVTHLVGKAIVKGDLETAALIFLAHSSRYEYPGARRAREKLAETKDFKQALSGFPAGLKYERVMLGHLISYPRDFLGAFKRLPLKLRELFVQAYQSFLFNRFLSERILSGVGLNEVCVGDFVVFFDECGLPMASGEIVNAKTVSRLSEVVKRGKASVAVPLVGARQRLSEGVQGEIERRILADEGVESEDFGRSVFPEVREGGGLRAVLVPLIKFVVDKPVKDDLGSSGLMLRLRFTLTRGSYATVTLREFMKSENPVEAGF